MALPEEEQMDAVFKSSRTDPVSGNEVPPGSLPEEVRDDIPAMLSEGEYVVPADVLRYYGVKFFEDLRSQAKMGMAEMEANGRIGGEPIEDEEEDLPFSDEELMVEDDGMPSDEEMNAALGGLVGFAEGGVNLPPETQVTSYGSGMFQQDPNDPTQVIIGGSSGTGYELITYYGPNGETVNIPFFNGMALGVIPPGYSRTAPKETAVEQVSPDDGTDYSTTTPKEQARMQTPEEMSNTQLRMNKAMLKAAGVLVPFGLAFTRGQIKDINAEIDNRKKAGIYGKEFDPLWDKDLEGIAEDKFKDPAVFKSAMEYLAPKGMRYDPTLKSTIGGKEVTGGYVRDDDTPVAWEDTGATQIDTTPEGVKVYKPGESTPRPRARPEPKQEDKPSEGGIGKAISDFLGGIFGGNDEEETKP